MAPSAMASWSAAEAEAVADGGFLASVHSLAEDQFLVANFVNPNQSQAVPLWLGLYDPDTGDGSGSQHAADFVWADGSSVDYTDWNVATGEPNNAGGIEYYTALAWHYSQLSTTDPDTWNDTPLNGSEGYGGSSNGPYFGIIEVPGSATPEPASLLLVGAGMAGLVLKRRFSA